MGWRAARSRQRRRSDRARGRARAQGSLGARHRDGHWRGSRLRESARDSSRAGSTSSPSRRSTTARGPRSITSGPAISGTGVGYFFAGRGELSLAAGAGIELDGEATPGAKPEARVQELLAKGDPRSRGIFETLGVYLGYGLLHYADLLPGEACALARAGHFRSRRQHLTRQGAVRSWLWSRRSWAKKRLTSHLLDEATRRVGQSIAAASLPPRGRAPRSSAKFESTHCGKSSSRTRSPLEAALTTHDAPRHRRASRRFGVHGRARHPRVLRAAEPLVHGGHRERWRGRQRAGLRVQGLQR